ncbi:MAG: FecR domain-containing protein [Desulfuromonadales bacterium]|nr:FecR domain-containing protein [Desulfuromonadales bacterium]
MKTLIFLSLFLIMSVLPVYAFSDAYALPSGSIGYVHTMKGAVSILRKGNVVQAAVGTPLYSGDLVRTEKPGAAGIVLIDNTTFSLGPNSELALTDYVFNPKEGQFSLVAKMAKGTFSYLSGLIEKLAPNSVKLGTPDATIAIRGTKLLIVVPG